MRFDVRLLTTTFASGTLLGVAIAGTAMVHHRRAVSAFSNTVSDSAYREFRSQASAGAAICALGIFVAVAAASLTAVFAYRWWRQARHLSAGGCPVCGYSERGWSSDCCPECGSRNRSPAKPV